MMKQLMFFCMIISMNTQADTIDHFMNIATNIPQMEMKADSQSQAWARSARTMLTLTSESIAETLLISNEAATQSGAPLFCPPITLKLDATTLDELIQKTYRENAQLSDKNAMTVSQIALLGLKKQYPCKQLQSTTSAQMEYVKRAVTGE